jgi:diaminopimelate epimerase
VIRFQKWHGLGNDFVLLDARASAPPPGLSELAVAVCHRRTGVGADGLLLLTADAPADAMMRVWNADGSEAQTCGNGLRCAAALLLAGREGESCDIATRAGTVRATCLGDGAVAVALGPAEPGAPEAVPVGIGGLTGTAVAVGNPHLVVFVEDVEAVPLETWGPLLERHPEFPEGTNVHFAQVLARDRVRQRTWERGAGATLACGTGAGATVVAGWRLGRTGRSVRFELPGGELTIALGPDSSLTMTGPAARSFTGSFPWLQG